MGFLKCNINAAFQESNGVTSWGFCCRAKGGAFKLARSEWQHPCLPVPIGEALGLMKALQWMASKVFLLGNYYWPLPILLLAPTNKAHSNSLYLIIFERDWKEVVDKVNSIGIDI